MRSTPEPGSPVGRDAPARAASVAYDEVALERILSWATRKAERCHKRGRAVGSADLFITFSPSGRVHAAKLVGEPIASAPVARCVLDYARAIKLPPFDGPQLTVSRSIVLR